MHENKKTIIYAGVAAVLLVLAILSSPGKITPEAFLDQGEEFFPDFDNPNEAATLEVMEFDQETGTAKPFKVTFKGNRWTIPSHHDYPADAKDRLAKTAAGIIDIKKDEFRTDNVSDHEACGVIDPLDETAGAAGRGTRVTVRDGSGQVLADIIIGKEIEMRRDYRYVRIPGQSRVYSAQVDVELTTRFEDWIDTDLLKLEKPKIVQMALKDYSVDERTGSVDNRDNLMLSKTESGWTAGRMSSGQMVDTSAIENLLTSVAQLSIVGVRPKPEGLSANLKAAGSEKQLTQNDIMSLQNKGFYLTRDNQLLSNEGELQVLTADGVLYTLRFGEVVYGSGLAVTAGAPGGSQEASGEDGESRYLFVTADFAPDFFKEPPKPRDESFASKPDSLWTDADRRNSELKAAHDAWKRNVADGRRRASELSGRFADWYYVISSTSYENIHLKRKDLIKSK